MHPCIGTRRSSKPLQYSHQLRDLWGVAMSCQVNLHRRSWKLLQLWVRSGLAQLDRLRRSSTSWHQRLALCETLTLPHDLQSSASQAETPLKSSSDHNVTLRIRSIRRVWTRFPWSCCGSSRNVSCRRQVCFFATVECNDSKTYCILFCWFDHESFCVSCNYYLILEFIRNTRQHPSQLL